MTGEYLQPPQSALELNRMHAVSALGQYLDNHHASPLRPHQLDTFKSLHAFLQQGNTAGYGVLPPGAGKTMLMTELARATGLRTVIISPTRPIVRQTYGTAKRIDPDASISNYYSEEKDTSGNVINTTPQSLNLLLSRGIINPEEIELLLYDEAHTALTETRL